METYWCCQKNSDINLNDGTISDLILIPCRKAECIVWRGGECIRIRKAGKPDYFFFPSLALSRNRRSNNGNPLHISSVKYDPRPSSRNYSFLGLYSFLPLIENIVFIAIIVSGKIKCQTILFQGLIRNHQ
jgi:hypothetical protein